MSTRAPRHERHSALLTRAAVVSGAAGAALSARVAFGLFVLVCLPLAAAAQDAGLRAVDWKSWLHGDPAPPAKAPPPKHIALVSSTVTNDPGFQASAATAQVETFMRAFAAALMARDGKPLLARLSPRYRIDDLPDDASAPEFFLLAIEQIPGPREIVIQSLSAQGDERVATIEFRFEEKTSVKTLRFDATGKLVSSDLFALKRMHGG